MELPTFQQIAPPAVSVLIAFLAFPSQWLFNKIEPGPLTTGETYLIDILAACILVCYWRTCLLDPGRIPKDWHNGLKASSVPSPLWLSPEAVTLSNRWCRRCEVYKPPRAHHCKTCKRERILTRYWIRCVMKMDHHCAWTAVANCVSHITIPHFIRFLFYAVTGMSFLEYFLFVRVAVLWDKRHLPSYLGPSVSQLALLFVLGAVNSFVLFALSLLLGKTVWSLAINTWTIESWEIERHHALLRRARTLGGYLHGPDGSKVYIKHQEFPWDVGIRRNICQGMGTSNPLAWLWPFSYSPSVESGLTFPHNQIDDPNKPWPPPDPDRLYRVPPRSPIQDASPFLEPWNVDMFRQRQALDLARYSDAEGDYVVRRKPFHERLERAAALGLTDEEYSDDDKPDKNQNVEQDDYFGKQPSDGERGRSRQPQKPKAGRNGKDGEEAWRNKEGERLADFGVDEVADFYDEDDVPLAKIIERRQQK